MNSLIFGLLAIFSLLAFVSLGKIKASTKQLNRSDRIKWRRYRDQDLAEIEDEWNDSAHDGPSIGLTIVKPNKSLHKCLCERNYIPFADERQNIMDKK